MKVRLGLAAILALLVVSLLAAQGQQPPIIFRVDVDLVEIDAVVTDAQGNVITNLTAEDFEILEDGRPQTITNFSLVNLPVERSDQPLFAAAPIEPDVSDNVGTEGRIYLFVLDDLHTTADQAPRVRDQARLFVQRYMGANDVAAVSYISGRAGDSQDFTGSKRLLLAAIDKFTSRKPTSLLPMDEQERAYNARTMMTSLRKQADFMSGVRGRRKAVLLFSEGVDFNVFTTESSLGVRGIEGPPPSTAILTATAASILDESQNAIAAATRGNVVFYAIDARGMTTPSDNVAVSADGGLAPISLGAETIPNPEAVRTDLQRAQLAADSLRALAANTGGFAVVNRNQFADPFDRILRENSTYYVMGYYPTETRRDGRFRRVTVRVRRPGLMVRARDGYIEPRGRANTTTTAAPAGDPVRAAANEAVASPLPVTGLPVRIAATPIKGPGSNATVALIVDIDSRAFNFVNRNGQMASRVDMTFAVTDIDAKVRATSAETATVRVNPDGLDTARAAGFRFVTRFDVPPGRYQVRVGAANEGGPSGSAIYDLDVPDFSRERVTMSGLAISSQQAGRAPTSRPNDPLRELLPVPAATNRLFNSGDTLALFAEFYENLPGAPAHAFDINTTLSLDGGRVVFEDFDSRMSSELQGGRGGFGYRVDIPLSGYAPGVYVLRVQGQSRTGNLPAVAREVQIRIQ